MSTGFEGINPVSAGITGITSSIQKILPPVQGEQEGKAVGLDEVKDSAFGSLFGSLIQNVKDTDAEFTQAQYLLATGQLDNPVQLGISAYKADVALDLLIQMRNKALDAYNELKNMSV